MTKITLAYKSQYHIKLFLQLAHAEEVDIDHSILLWLKVAKTGQREVRRPFIVGVIGERAALANAGAPILFGDGLLLFF